MATTLRATKRLTKLTAFKSKEDEEVNKSVGAVGDSELSNRQEITVLKNKIVELENKNNSLYYENEKLNLDLEHERHKVMQLERKLQFVKDNQSTFEQLRETYMNVKYNENNNGRKLVEIRDKSIQTWGGILCRACLDTEKIRSKLEAAKNIFTNFEDYVIVKQADIDKIKATLQLLKCYNELREIDFDAKDLQLDFDDTSNSSESQLFCSELIRTKLRLEKLEEDKKLLLEEHGELLRNLSSDEDLIYYNNKFDNKM